MNDKFSHFIDKASGPWLPLICMLALGITSIVVTITEVQQVHDDTAPIIEKLTTERDEAQQELQRLSLALREAYWDYSVKSAEASQALHELHSLKQGSQP